MALLDSLDSDGSKSNLKEQSKLVFNLVIDCFKVKFYDRSKKSRNSFIFNISELDFIMVANESTYVQDEKEITQIKYSFLSTINKLAIQDNVKNQIFSNLLELDNDQLSIYFRIKETLINKKDNLVIQQRRKSTRRKSLSFGGNSPEFTRKRLMSDDNDYKTESERYFDEVACILNIQPTHVYLHNNSTVVLK